MKQLLVLAALAGLVAPAMAGEAGDLARDQLYAGNAAQAIPATTEDCDAGNQEACFALGLLTLVGTYEGFAQDLYRYGATTPGSTPAALLFGLGLAEVAPANPSPEPLTYLGLRTVLEDFLADLDAARAAFEKGGEAGDYVVAIDPLKVRIDFNGDGKHDDTETLAALLNSVGEFADIPAPDGPPPGGKTKTPPAPEDTSVGFDRADSIWFAGYSQVAAAPIDLILAHDFSDFFNAYLHQVFPKSGLPMQDYMSGGVLFLDANSDAGIADMVAAIHTMNFPVLDTTRLAGVLTRLKSITALSRKNWEAILAETDDNRELVPSPTQTPLFPDMPVTQETVDAWMATLDTVDEVLDGKLLVPHWRFKQGFDLKAYFETTTRTDIVMLLTGSGALPYLRDGPIADAQSFAEANRVFGTNWLNYAFWFN
jgi:hypothetical protein